MEKRRLRSWRAAIWADPEAIWGRGPAPGGGVSYLSPEDPSHKEPA